MATKTLNISLDEELIINIDKAVAKDMGSRSEYFRRLAIRDLEKRLQWRTLLSRGKKVGHQMGIDSEEQVYAILNESKRDKQQAQATNRT